MIINSATGAGGGIWSSGRGFWEIPGARGGILTVTQARDGFVRSTQWRRGMQRKMGGGEKSFIPRHRGRRGNFWGDPGKGHPGSRISRASMDAQSRTIERRTRREGEEECEEGLDEYDED